MQGISAATRGSEALAEEVSSWIDKLSVTVEVIDSWAHVQSIWMQVLARSLSFPPSSSLYHGVGW